MKKISVMLSGSSYQKMGIKTISSSVTASISINSEGIVKLVAQERSVKADLGMKGKHIKNMKRWESFLIDESHRIRFVYMPKHSS